MADKPSLPPPSEPFPGSRTPGWNDPPTLQYSNSTVPSTGRTRLNLNKRVAFPLQGPSSTNTKPMAIVPPNQANLNSGIPQLPPMGTTNVAVVHPMRVPPIVPVITPNTNNPSESSGVVNLPLDVQEFTLRTLREQAVLVQESAKVKRDEIDRRLGTITQLWQTNNLSSMIQEKLYLIAKAISNRNFNEAMDVYTSLATNYCNECSSWAIALRHVILTLQSSNTALEQPQTTDDLSDDIIVPTAPLHLQESNSPVAAGFSAVQHI